MALDYPKVMAAAQKSAQVATELQNLVGRAEMLEEYLAGLSVTWESTEGYIDTDAQGNMEGLQFEPDDMDNFVTALGVFLDTFRGANAFRMTHLGKLADAPGGTSRVRM